MISLADVATQLNICKIMALALPRFYRKTQISASITFIYSPQSEGMEIRLGFDSHEPTDEQYSILFEEILDAEKLLMNEYIVNNSGGFDNLKQFVFKHKEDMKQIVDKQKHH